MSPRLIQRLLASAAAFRSDKRGQVAITFGLTLVPMITLLGAAVDFSNLRRSKTVLQANVDAVVLGAQQQSITTNSALMTYAQRFLPTVTSAIYTASDGSMCVTATQGVSTNFLKLAQINSMTTTASACSLNQVQTTGTYEIALALDNTGSMAVADTTTARTKMASEITAAKAFITQMYAAIPAANMKISLVPFTTAVNVGSGYSNATWMDTQGKSSIHWENFPKLGTAVSSYQQTAEASISSRFDLYSQINQSWAGCVEERPQPYTFTDTQASSSTPDTLYVPMFAPDESDTPNSGYRSYNSYLSDLGGTCVNGDKYDTVDAGTASGSITATYKDGTRFWGDNQQKFCKYLMKYSALTPPTLDVQNTIASWLSANGSPGSNNWTINGSANGNYQVPAATIASLIANSSGSNKIYNVNSSSTAVSFCTNFNVSYSNQNGYYISNNNCASQTSNYATYAGWFSGYYTAQSTGLLSAAQANNPVGTAWSAATNTITSTGWAASNSYTAWTGSGWGFGGSGWGSGNGWGWGTGLNSSTNNPGQTASGQTSTQHIGKNQFNIGGGANSGCDATLQPVTTLTNNSTTLKANLDKMVANGATNLVSGMMWAWRTISPNGPFNTTATPVKAYGTANNKKIIVFMTDGFNNWEDDDSQNGGVYSALGYYKNNRAGALTVNGSSQTPTAGNNRSYLDAAFLQACTNAKNAGVEIYTVAFSIPNAPIDTQGQTTVQSCATDSAHYFKATNGTELSSFFQSIGQSITQSYLRLKS